MQGNNLYQLTNPTIFQFNWTKRNETKWPIGIFLTSTTPIYRASRFVAFNNIKRVVETFVTEITWRKWKLEINEIATYRTLLRLWLQMVANAIHLIFFVSGYPDLCIHYMYRDNQIQKYTNFQLLIKSTIEKQYQLLFNFLSNLTL